jgi:hypothetical protein
VNEGTITLLHAIAPLSVVVVPARLAGDFRVRAGRDVIAPFLVDSRSIRRVLKCHCGSPVIGRRRGG